MPLLRALLTALAVARRRCRPLAQEFITVASTTSTENSGLFGHILPLFQEKTGIEVRVVAQGTGQALETGKRGDADVVFVHARAAEDAFVAEGWGVQRFDVMYNDFVIVGPADDPAGIRGGTDAAAALAAIAASEAHLRLARRRFRHPPGREGALGEGGRRPVRRLVPRDRQRHGRDAQHRRRAAGLCADRPRHLDQLREQGRPGDRSSKATRRSSTPTA